ncbi:MAG: uroporphyrinogen-III decarboxylase-like protein [Clostridiales bacterium]|nr:uroporphyrinogen-III decarboxylase-like protein [Clostridiales bacterium]
MRNPNFNNLVKVLQCGVPDRPTLFELFLNDPLYIRLAGPKIAAQKDKLYEFRLKVHAFRNAGYDYATVYGSDFKFPVGETHMKKTVSLNEGGIISDRGSFDKYKWPDPEESDYSNLEGIKDEMPEGMKLVIMGPGGVLENVINLVGYDNLCYMIYEDPELAGDVFGAVGTRLISYYEICSRFDTVGALVSNDDWGFNTQTMLSPNDLRKYVFPWHKRIVEVIHSAGKLAILHSCGKLDCVMEDVIEDMKFDGKHSFEDNILPVEEAYEKWGGRIGILGGIDLDFVCRASHEEIKARSLKMLKRTENRGGYALGTGNSVPDYVPDDSFFAMTSAVLQV